VRPVEPGRGVARGDVLVSVVERVLEGAAPGVPGGQKLLVGAPPEQPRAIPAHPPAHLGDARLVAVRDPPAAALKPIPRVLIRATWSLHHAVKGHPVHDDYLSHLISRSFGFGSPDAPPGDSRDQSESSPSPATRTRSAQVDTATNHRPRRPESTSRAQEIAEKRPRSDSDPPDRLDHGPRSRDRRL